MSSELHLSPDRLRVHAATAAALAAELASAGARPGPADAGADQLRTDVRRGAAQLAELSDALYAAAATAHRGDAAVLDAVRAFDRPAPPGLGS